ncbi:MAG: imidazole glycerol phosphate synthase subunit HisH [Methylococcales bacterium]|jgi:imidazole glycerol-phosphate synthase subunit HisH|nr:imidazole glycerol phosphate synthase subunit HisH [Methylococcales bacterium]
MSKPIAIVDYGMGNVGSIYNMLRKIGIKAKVVSEPEQLLQAYKIIFPGVGAFDAGVKQCRSSGFWDVLQEAVLEQQIPILGICLGMQLMAESSEEGRLPGFAWVDAEVVKFIATDDLKVPHMRWNTATLEQETPLFSCTEEEKYYFIHSYYVHCRQASDILATTRYGNQFVAAFQHENILGVQFHPEKSHRHGMAFLKQFAEVFSP